MNQSLKLIYYELIQFNSLRTDKIKYRSPLKLAQLRFLIFLCYYRFISGNYDVSLNDFSGEVF